MTRTRGAEYPSPAMQKNLADCLKVAGTDSTGLLLAESASGKNFLVRYIRNHSERSDGLFFGINCAALPPELAESELFGHEARAFTGANGTKKGVIELAERGTLLLNEVGKMSRSLQAKPLTFLNKNRFVRVGGERGIDVDTHIIALVFPAAPIPKCRERASETEQRVESVEKEKTMKLELSRAPPKTKAMLPTLPGPQRGLVAS